MFAISADSPKHVRRILTLPPVHPAIRISVSNCAPAIERVKTRFVDARAGIPRVFVVRRFLWNSIEKNVRVVAGAIPSFSQCHALKGPGIRYIDGQRKDYAWTECVNSGSSL